MTNPFFRLAVAAFLLTCIAATAAERSADRVARNHQRALDSFRSAQVRAYLEGNPKAMLEHQADTVRLMPAYQKTVLGKSDAMTYHQAFLRRFSVHAYDRQAIEAIDLGQRVMEIGRFTMTLGAKGSAEAHTLTGKYMDLWEKSATGRLLLNTAAWNYDQPADIAEQLRFAEVPSIHMALQARAPVSAGISLELAALSKLQESAITQHDGNTWALFFADDAIQLSNHGPFVSGRKALDEYMAEHAKALAVFEKLDLRTDRIDDLGQYVIEYASGVAIWRRNEYSGVSLGKNIRIWRRADHGALQIWRAISMYD